VDLLISSNRAVFKWALASGAAAMIASASAGDQQPRFVRVDPFANGLADHHDGHREQLHELNGQPDAGAAGNPRPAVSQKQDGEEQRRESGFPAPFSRSVRHYVKEREKRRWEPLHDAGLLRLAFEIQRVVDCLLRGIWLTIQFMQLFAMPS